MRLHVLRDAVNTWREKYGQRAWIRALEGPVARHHEDRVMEVIARFDGKPFPSTAGLARSWLAGRFRRSSSLEAILRRARGDHLPAHGPAARAAPGELVRPGRFWSGDEIGPLSPFVLGREVPVG